MTNKSDIIRAEPIPGNMLDTLRLEGIEGLGVTDYPNRLARRFRQSEIAAGLEQLAVIVEPVDRVLGMDASKPAAKAFRVGGLIGLRVTAACVDDIDVAFSRIALIPSVVGPDDADKLHIRQVFAKEIIDVGDEAYAAVEDRFLPLFDEWEDQLVPDVRHQRFLRSGFGLPMAYLFARHSLNQATDLANMEAQINAAEGDGLDWDALLK